MRNLTLALFLVFGVSTFSQPASGALVSTARNGLLDGMPVLNGDLIAATAGASDVWVAEEDIFGLGVDGLAQNLDVDALALLPDGRVVFSVDKGQEGVIDGLAFGDGDLVAYDPADGSVEMFLAEAELGEDVDVDAVHVRDDGSLLMSFSVTAVTLGVKDGDVYEYDPATGIGSVLVGEEEMFSAQADVNGISVVGDSLALTTREAAAFHSGHAIEASEVALYDPASGEASAYLSLVGRMVVGEGQKVDVDAVAYLPECSDGIDNDGDGYVDMGDPACPAAGADAEGTSCQDGVDNDGNGLVDFDGGVSILGEGHPGVTDPDPGCTGLAWMSNESPTECGLGFELTLLLPPLLWLRRGRRVRRPALDLA